MVAGFSLDGGVTVADDLSAPLEQEVAYVSGVGADGSVAASNWWQDQRAQPRKWGSPETGSSGGVVTYAFSSTSPWSAADEAMVSAGLALWSAVANIQFVQVGDDPWAPPPIVFYDEPNEYTPTGTVGYAVGGDLAPGTIGSLVSGESTFDQPQIGLIGPLGSFTATGGYGVDTILHEEGHLLGLGGTGDYNGVVDPATQQLGPYDSRQWSVMSYINPADSDARYHSYYSPPGASWGYDSNGYAIVPTTWMPVDILAIQRLYGLPIATPLSGGQIFGFHCNIAGPIEPFFDFSINQTPVVTLWDEGGGNTLDVSGFSQPATIDLRPGGFSSVDGMTENIAIALGTSIDTAIGGPGNTVFVLNADSDSITGGGGQDEAIFPAGGMLWKLAGLAGDPIASAGPVADTLQGVGTLAFAGGASTIVAHVGGGFALSGGGNELFLGAAPATVSLCGGDTVLGGIGPVSIAADGSGAGNLVWDTAGPLTYTGGQTADTVVAGAAASVEAGSRGLFAYEKAGDMTFQGGAGCDTAAAGAGVLHATAGPGGGVLVGGAAGGNVLTAGAAAGQVIAFAGGPGDTISFGNAQVDVAVLATGAETVDGAANTAGVMVYTEAANALIVGGAGNDSFDLGSGRSTITGGGGINVYVFADGGAGGSDVITDWDPSRDFVFLVGYGVGADASAVASQVQAGGNTIVTLQDRTQITFQGVAGVGDGSFW